MRQKIVDAPANPKVQIISSTSALTEKYHSLQKGDILFGRVRIRPGEDHILADFLHRGVLLIPSALSQALSRSKVLQARVYQDLMLPLTRAIYTIHDLQQAMQLYYEHSVAKVVVKLNNKNAGIGILIWPSIEEVYNHASCGSLSFPFVIQPFLATYTDIRVIILGDYVEAYSRHNKRGGRCNLHFGGTSSQTKVPVNYISLCKEVMQRADFPYAHIDITQNDDGNPYLGEINLRGGLRGAKISSDQYQQKTSSILNRILDETLQAKTWE